MRAWSAPMVSPCPTAANCARKYGTPGELHIPEARVDLSAPSSTTELSARLSSYAFVELGALSAVRNVLIDTCWSKQTCSALLGTFAASTRPDVASSPTPGIGPRPDFVLIRGQIEASEPGVLTVRDSGGIQRIVINDKSGYSVMVSARLNSIGPGDFVGIASERRPDGELQAIEVHIFPEAMRGTGEGHYPWDIPRPGGTTMTNAAVSAVVDEVDGPVLTLSPQGQAIKITVPPAAQITRIDLRPAADVLRVGYRTVVVARKAPDGQLVALRVYTGEAGAMPPL